MFILIRQFTLADLFIFFGKIDLFVRPGIANVHTLCYNNEKSTPA